MTKNKRHRSRGARGSAIPNGTRERLIFKYWNGSRYVLADPIKVQRELVSFPDLNLETDVKLIQLSAETVGTNAKIGKEVSDACLRIISAVRQVFSVKPLTDLGNGKTEGLTEAETISLLHQFGAFIQDLKKKADISLTSPKPMDSPANVLAMPSIAGSGGTATASAPSVHSPSQSA